MCNYVLSLTEAAVEWLWYGECEADIVRSPVIALLNQNGLQGGSPRRYLRAKENPTRESLMRLPRIASCQSYCRSDKRDGLLRRPKENPGRHNLLALH